MFSNQMFDSIARPSRFTKRFKKNKIKKKKKKSELDNQQRPSEKRKRMKTKREKSNILNRMIEEFFASLNLFSLGLCIKHPKLAGSTYG